MWIFSEPLNAKNVSDFTSPDKYSMKTTYASENGVKCFLLEENESSSYF